MYCVTLDGDGRVVGIPGTTTGTAVKPPLYKLGDANAKTIRAAGIWFEGTSIPRWHLDPATDTLTPRADTRVTGTWSRTVVDLAVGDPAPTVRLTLSESRNDSRRLVRFGGAHLMALTFVDGVADVVVSTDAPGRMRLSACKDFALTNGLDITIADNVIRPE